ncbi:MAG: hypothetical protein HZC40_05360 [Chloroflexi bacterium]|nr:hypothetical protein [Chloroflexota bacterium]
MKKVKRDPIPKEFRTLKEAGEFWDTHSAADYWDQMEDVEMKVDIQGRRFVVLLDDAIYRVAQQRAKAKHQSPDEFVNQLLRKELARAAR